MPVFDLDSFVHLLMALDADKNDARLQARPRWPVNAPAFTLISASAFAQDQSDLLDDIVVAGWDRHAIITPDQVSIEHAGVVAIGSAQLKIEWDRRTAGMPHAARSRSNEGAGQNETVIDWRIIGPAPNPSGGLLDATPQIAEALSQLGMPVMSDSAIAVVPGTYLRYFAISPALIYVERRSDHDNA
jgi:hypothetical protein